MAKYKVGDTVHIRNKAWIDEQPKGKYGELEIGITMIEDMYKYAGRRAQITAMDGGAYSLNIDDQKWQWEDWMFDDPADPDILSPEEAIKAMMDDGETLVTLRGEPCRWVGDRFLVERGLYPKEMVEFTNLRRRPTEPPKQSKRPATRWEWINWANSESSRGWVVRHNNSSWLSPQYFSYNGSLKGYQRARLLPDLSGVDESTIQGLEVEE
jgi:hypothetical protein